MTTIHFVYAHGPLRSCPNAISTELTKRLTKWGYRVIQHPWEKIGRIQPGKGDVLLGHPNSLPFTFFRCSLSSPAWSRVIILYPYAHGVLGHSSFIDGFIGQCDLFLAITGRYWFEDVCNSRFRHWRPKMIHVDLAINREHFPFVKHSFNASRHRRLLYIGGQQSYKNIDYLLRIRRACPQWSFTWIGRGWRPMPGFDAQGYVDFQTAEGRDLVTQHDFLITVGHSDPNPTTILEAMGWGLIPACTKQSGYVASKGVVNLPLDDVAGAVRVLEDLQVKPETELRAMQQHNLAELDRHYNWDRFANQVRAAIESGDSPRLDRQSLANWLVLRANMHLFGERALLFLKPSGIKGIIHALRR